VAVGIGTKQGGENGRTVGGALRAAGRVALWALVALLLIEGVSGVLAPPPRQQDAGVDRSEASDPATSAFATSFARVYLSGASPQELSPLLAPGVDVPSFSGTGIGVEQAEVAGIEDLGAGEAIVTVACATGDARILYLAVPIVRASAGEVAAQGVPALVAGPAGVGEPIDAPGPLAGPDAGAIADLTRRFLPVYLSAPGAEELAYLLAPGARVTPPGGGLEVTDVPSVKQLGSAEGRRRTVIAGVRVLDSLSGSSFGLAYRLEVTRGDGRWYVERVEGALS
jgi:Conjugative transposon protein TcpC